MPTPTLLPGARTMLLNALAQNNVDMNGFQLWNLDTSNLSLGGPNNFPAIAHEWLNAYSSTTHNFSASRPLTTDLGDFPSISGQSGKFFTNNGSVLSWAAIPGANSFLNVKDYGAVGDGSTDDFAAIQAAINASITKGPGLSVYFPYGTYYISRNLDFTGPGWVTGPQAVSFLGDSPYVSVLRANPALGGAMIQLASSSYIARLGFDGGLSRAVQPVPGNTVGINALNAAQITIVDCAVTNCSSSGIFVNGCYGVNIRDCAVFSVGGYGIDVYNSPRSLVWNNQVIATVLSGIYVANSPFCAVQDNQIFSCGANGYGIAAIDSDNTVISGNNIAQCLVGILCMTSAPRMSIIAQQSFGYTVTGNNVMRNYYAGILLWQANGFQVTGNTLCDNGQGGTDSGTYTVEPGIVIDPTSPGTNQGKNYQVGDVLTLSGGTGTPAQVMVTKVVTIGANSGCIATDGLAIMNPGSYTVFPAKGPVAVTGGHGTLAKVLLSGSFKSSTNDTGYVNGQVLVATNGTFYNAVRVMVTRVDGNGAVLSYQVLDGGGYTGSLPATLTFQNDGFASQYADSSQPPNDTGPLPPPLTPASGGFQLTPSWAARYSILQQGQTTYNIGTFKQTFGGLIQSNVLDTCKTGCGYLNEGDGSDASHRANYLCITGNSFINNLYPIKGKTLGGALDNLYNFSSVIANNIYYPSPPS